MDDNKKPYTRETGNQEHDPVETGRKAIEADRKVNQDNKEPGQQQEDEAKDADQWRNEG